MIYDKPFLSYEDQLERLKNIYKLKSINKETDLILLNTISYYDLVNGYKECFMKENKFNEDNESWVKNFIYSAFLYLYFVITKDISNSFCDNQKFCTAFSC